MNHRIQVLAEQAQKSVPQGILGIDQWIEYYNNQLAQLIIQECITALKTDSATHDPRSTFLASELSQRAELVLLQHFEIPTDTV